MRRLYSIFWVILSNFAGNQLKLMKIYVFVCSCKHKVSELSEEMRLHDSNQTPCTRNCMKFQVYEGKTDAKWFCL